MKQFFSYLQPEASIFIVFFWLNFFIHGTATYLLLCLVTLCVLYFFSKKFSRSVWFLIFFLLFFNKGRDITFDFYGNYFYSLLPLSLSLLRTQWHQITLTISFTDFFLIFLLFCLKTKHEIPLPRLQDKWLNISIFLLIFISCLAAIESPLPTYAWYYAWIFCRYLLFFYLATIIFQDKKIVQATQQIFVVFVSLLSILLVIQKLLVVSSNLIGNTGVEWGKFADENQQLFRPGGLTWDSNFSATLLIMILPIVFFSFIQKKTMSKKMILFIVIILSSVGIFFCASRGVWLTGLFLFIWIKLQIQSIYPTQLTLTKKRREIVLLISVLLIMLLFTSIYERLASLFIDGVGPSILFRLHQFQLASWYIKNNWLGVGHNVEQYLLPKDFPPSAFDQDPTPVLNLSLEVITSIGIVGGFIFYAVILIILVKVYGRFIQQKNFFHQKGAFFSAIAFLLASQFYAWLYEPKITTFFWVIMGYLYAQLLSSHSKADS